MGALLVSHGYLTREEALVALSTFVEKGILTEEEASVSLTKLPNRAHGNGKGMFTPESWSGKESVRYVEQAGFTEGNRLPNWGIFSLVPIHRPYR